MHERTPVSYCHAVKLKFQLGLLEDSIGLHRLVSLPDFSSLVDFHGILSDIQAAVKDI